MDFEADVVPARTGRAFRMRGGQFVRVTNIHGSQVVDTWAISADDPLETSSMDHTRSLNSNIFFTEGMVVFSSRRRPMLAMVKDSAGVRHDTLLCPCSRELYTQLGFNAHHRSCTDNFHEALAEEGVALNVTPASLNLFMNVPVSADGAVDRLPPSTTAGDYVVMRAEMDLVLVLSACPQDVTPINGERREPNDVAVQIFDAFPSEETR
jgi:hypothetical protein